MQKLETNTYMCVFRISISNKKIFIYCLFVCLSSPSQNVLRICITFQKKKLTEFFRQIKQSSESFKRSILPKALIVFFFFFHRPLDTIANSVPELYPTVLGVPIVARVLQAVANALQVFDSSI